MSYESARYAKVAAFRTLAVEHGFFYKKGSLLDGTFEPDPGVAITIRSLEKKEFKSVDEALAAVRKALDGRRKNTSSV